MFSLSAVVLVSWLQACTALVPATGKLKADLYAALASSNGDAKEPEVLRAVELLCASNPTEAPARSVPKSKLCLEFTPILTL